MALLWKETYDLKHRAGLRRPVDKNTADLEVGTESHRSHKIKRCMGWLRLVGCLKI